MQSSYKNRETPHNHQVQSSLIGFIFEPPFTNFDGHCDFVNDIP
jgi:hypothetical protein